MTAAAGLPPLRIGTRGSALAVAQTTAVAEQLRDRGTAVALVEVTTDGDRSAAAVTELGGTGVFVTALRQRLADGELDVAVHSLKDLPTAPDERLALAAVPPREDPRDAVFTRDGTQLADLPAGSTVGTGSPRRAAQLRTLAPHVTVVPVRGNVDTRLRKVADGELDAVVVAVAGLARLGRLAEATEVLPLDGMLPAPGQGALALECRADDEATRTVLAVLDDPPSRAVVTAERAVLAGLRAGCTAPVGAHASPTSGPLGDPHLVLDAVVAAPRGDGIGTSIRLTTTGPLGAAEQIGRELATDLLSAGADELLRERT